MYYSFIYDFFSSISLSPLLLNSVGTHLIKEVSCWAKLVLATGRRISQACTNDLVPRF